MTDIIVIGASSGPGRLLYEALQHRGENVVGIARESRGLTDTDTSRFVALDATDTGALRKLVDGSRVLIHCSRPEILTALLQAGADIERLIAVGSTRIYTRFPDDKCTRLAAMAHTIWMGDIPATILHPTMIYGAPGLNNIERVIRAAKLSPWIPLPDKGSALIQPVHAEDVVRALLICLEDENTCGRTLVIAGRSPVTYREFIELCIETGGAECRVVSIPYLLLSLLGLITRFIPGLPGIGQDEIRRLRENKDFDISDMTNLLGSEPLDLATGLKRAFGPPIKT